MDMGLVPYDTSSSPVDGSSGSGDDTKIAVPTLVPTMGVLGKPMATNNFVTKLYQMITDAKSSHFISWTELGTSFVVSNVGEFSRSILGSHFKHNNVRIPVCFLPAAIHARRVMVMLYLFLPFDVTPPIRSAPRLFPPSVFQLRAPIKHVWLPQDQPHAACAAHDV
jgi:hypothetical protein